ncbi:chemotaxis protein CheD [Ideonella livida]|nr:chemotaxis protein CheD [Ideonella livida]
MPGQWYFGHQPSQIRTLLGSCVAVTLWHPGRRVGGMCHFLLPQRHNAPAPGCVNEYDGRYGNEAVAMLVHELEKLKLRPGEFIAHLYGGADTMPDQAGVKLNVGERNIEMGWQLIDRHGFQLDGVDVGDHIPRTVTLAMDTGQVEVRRGRRH